MNGILFSSLWLNPQREVDQSHRIPNSVQTGKAAMQFASSAPCDSIISKKISILQAMVAHLTVSSRRSKKMRADVDLLRYCLVRIVVL